MYTVPWCNSSSGGGGGAMWERDVGRHFTAADLVNRYSVRCVPAKAQPSRTI
jgi:hypothetical protein